LNESGTAIRDGTEMVHAAAAVPSVKGTSSVLLY